MELNREIQKIITCHILNINEINIDLVSRADERAIIVLFDEKFHPQIKTIKEQVYKSLYKSAQEKLNTDIENNNNKKSDTPTEDIISLAEENFKNKYYSKALENYKKSLRSSGF